jgi:hypothetical protein
VLFGHVERFFEKAVTEVVLEAGRGPVGGKKLRLDVALWDRIRALALPRYDLQDDTAGGLSAGLPELIQRGRKTDCRAGVPAHDGEESTPNPSP